MKTKTVNEIYSEWKTGKGFFYYLFDFLSDSEIECDFIPDSDTAEILDMKYHAGFSGDKITSTFVDKYLDDSDGLSEEYKQRFAAIFWKLNSTNLLREWEIQTADYNPLNNYDMSETYSGTNSGSNSNTTTHNSTTTNTGTDTTRTNTDITTETGANGSSVVEHDLNGFNSSGSGVPADSTTTRDKTTTTGTGTNNYSAVEHGHTITDSGGMSSTGSNSGSDSHTLTRSGNIGVTTSVEMLSKHGELWNMWNFYDSVLFPAVDKLIAIPIY